MAKMAIKDRQDVPDYLKGPLGYEDDTQIEDWASGLLEHMSYDYQLMAVHAMIQLCRKDNNDHSEAIKRADDAVRRFRGAERAIDEWCDLVHQSGFLGAAHSMAVVGMLAPLIESIFHRVFATIRKEFADERPFSAHSRWSVGADLEWDYHLEFSNGSSRRNVVAGIFQLSDAVGLTKHLPSDLKPTLEALFAYRNKMFHCGFEWPPEERAKFAKLISEKQWNDWFKTFDVGNDKGFEPWVFYLSDSFVDHCLERVGQIVTGTAMFAEERLKAERVTNHKIQTDASSKIASR
jgi:hypothetical protein